MTANRTPSPSAADAQAGFSLVEGLIAAALLLLIALGILPLFGQAMANNARGESSTEVSNSGRSTLEEYFQLPFDHTRLAVAAGTTETVTPEYYVNGTAAGGVRYYYWSDTAPSGSIVQYDRTVSVRQYQIVDVTSFARDEPVPLVEEPLDGGADASVVHVKEVDVEVESGRTGGPLGGGSRVRLRLFKPY